MGQGSHQSQSQRTSYESGPAIFHCVTVMGNSRGGGGGSGGMGGRGEGVIFIAICDKGFPKRLAYGYLEELAREFDSQFHNQVRYGSDQLVPHFTHKERSIEELELKNR